MGCLSEDALVHYAAGTLEAADAVLAEAHLAACSDCPERLQRISSLILSRTRAQRGSSSDAATQSNLAVTSATPSTVDTAPMRGPSVERGTKLGRYTILERLGTGGMGEVYAAHDPQLDRRIALKLLRPGALADAEGQKRLEREAQSMARLQHANVVAVHDVGRSENRVFVAMEFIDGESLTEWLRGGHPWAEVLALMLDAGAGLAAAHDAGVVHRDFKPDNVLIGGDGRPRVLDFGLARHTSHSRDAKAAGELPDVPLEGPEAAQLTRDGAIMGTPGYMAPEQLAGLPSDARSDQFSFCVTLWEAVYGKRPFGGATLKAHAAQVTAGKLPAPPAGTQVPAWVHHALERGLSTDPGKRWPSMRELISALTPKKRTTSRWVVAGVVALAATAAVAAGIAASNRDRLRVCGGTRERLTGIWDESTRKSLEGQFAAARKSGGDDRWKATQTALDTYATAWVKASEETCTRGRIQKLDPETIYAEKSLCLEGLLRQLHAQTRLLATGDDEVLVNGLRAVRSLDPVAQCTDGLALAGRKRDHAGTHSPEEETLALKLRDARARYDTGQYARSAEEAMQALRAQGPAWLLADGWLLVGKAQARAGQNGVAQQSLFDAAVYAEQAGTADAAARAWSRLAGVVTALGTDFPEAHKDLRLARANAERAGMDPDLEADLENSGGQLDLAEGNYTSARTRFTHALNLQETALGARHPESAMTLNNLGVALSRLGLYDEALETYHRALLVHLETSGPEHPNTASTMQNLAVLLTRKQQFSEALDYARKALAIREAAFGPNSAEVANSLGSLSRLYRKMGNPEEGLLALNRALSIREQEGAESVAAAQAHDDLAHFYFERKDFKEALGHAERAITLMDKLLGPKTPRSAGTREMLGVVLANLGQWERSKHELDQALAVRRERLGEVHPDVASSINALGDLSMLQGHFAEARGLYQQALEVRTKALGDNRPELAVDLGPLGRALLALHKPEDAARVLARAVSLREKGDDASDLALARFDLARALWETNAEGQSRALALCGEAHEVLTGDAQALVDAWVKAHPAPSK